MGNNERRHTIDVLFVIALFCVFAVSLMLLTGTGASVYRSIVDSMTENFNSRTSVTYVLNKIHQSDLEGRVSVETFEGTSCLALSEEIDNVAYCTYLYYDEGSIKELLTRVSSGFDPSYGTQILAVDSFDATEITKTLYRFDITPVGGKKEVLFVHVRSEQN